MFVGIAAALWAWHAAKDVRAQAQESEWLAHHGVTASYRVNELGEQRRDGSATAVWVSRGNAPDAFVDLSHSRQAISRRGQMVQARIDGREPGRATGVATDAIGRSFVTDYLGAGWPFMVTLAAVAALLALRSPEPLSIRRRSSSG